MKRLPLLLLVWPFLAVAADAPSRPPGKGCAWEKFSNVSVGLEAWVQRCDYGFRKIDFVARGHSLAMRYSDGGAPENVVDVIDRLPGESAEAAVTRIFTAHTDKALARRCGARPYHGVKARKDVRRYTFVLKKPVKTPDGDVPEPPCGEWGDAPDGIQYFEVHPTKIFFVRVGQDVPLFDEQTLRSAK